MNLLGNLIWLVCGGLISAILWWFVGAVWCITIIGIPVGLQCFKLSSISLNPFGKDVAIDDSNNVSFLINLVWIVIFGLELAVAHFVFGCFLCLTIIGIPFGRQYFKIAKLALFPFGARIVRRR